MEPGPHVEEMETAIRADGEGLRALLDGDEAVGRDRLLDAVGHYRASWELAPPRSFGRLIGMLKAAVIAGDAADAAAYARAAVPEADSPPSGYVRAVAALVEGDDDLAAPRDVRSPDHLDIFSSTKLRRVSIALAHDCVSCFAG